MRENSALTVRISRLARDIGVPAHIKGYDYIKSAILKCYKDREYIGSITKALYPDIAKEFDTTPSRVERAIRHAIEVAYHKSNYTFRKVLLDDAEKQPTNSLFIATLVDYLQLEDADDLASDSEEDAQEFGESYNIERNPEIKKLKEHIVELRISAISNSIPRGHCPYAYYMLDGEGSEDCSNVDCDACRNQFLSNMREKIKKEVFSPDYLNQ